MRTGDDQPMDPAVEPHLATSALLTIDTQVDTLDGQPLEIPGTSAVLARAVLARIGLPARPWP